jgi:ribosomal protein S18 acetylase RimI-like enzyme
MEPSIRRATDVDHTAVLETISQAFFRDPVWSWAFPDDAQRREVYPQFWDFFVTAAMRNDSVYVADDGAATTVWTPPGMPELTDDEEAALVEFLRDTCGDRIDVVLEAVGRIDLAHPKDEAHEYLGIVATHPDHAGKRLGVTLIAHHLRVVDAEHLPAYLESSNPANLARYRKLGFEPREEFPLADGGPRLTTMWRPAR